MVGKVISNERTQMAQDVRRQPDGPGKRIGKKAEISIVAKVTPDGAKLFRERVAQFQAEAAYWEKRVGTVHDFRVALFDNDTRLLFAVTYDGDFKPYLADITEQAGEWLDGLFVGVVEGFKGLRQPGAAEFLLPIIIEADFFYASNPDASVRDVEKMTRLSRAVGEFLDAAS